MTEVAAVLTWLETTDIYPYLLGFAIVSLAGFIFRRLKSAAK